MTPQWVKKYITTYKDYGLKGLIKKTPIWVLVLLFLFFLLKGILLYVLIPYLLTKGFLT
tara:strand:+ start:584 stop:760 length:177 start_codon:yes stop_codon:yes gene_type:complete